MDLTSTRGRLVVISTIVRELTITFTSQWVLSYSRVNYH